jgi:hypothetical protein
MSNLNASPFSMLTELCGCGRPVRYQVLDDVRGSCNTQLRCPDYESLRAAHALIYSVGTKMAAILDRATEFSQECAICLAPRRSYKINGVIHAAGCWNLDCLSHEIRRAFPTLVEARSEPATQILAQTDPAAVSPEVARSLRSVVRAMHDGLCPQCGILCDAEDMRKGRGYTQCASGWRCPECEFYLSEATAKAALQASAAHMAAHLAAFRAWHSGMKKQPAAE